MMLAPSHVHNHKEAAVDKETSTVQTEVSWDDDETDSVGGASSEASLEEILLLEMEDEEDNFIFYYNDDDEEECDYDDYNHFHFPKRMDTCLHRAMNGFAGMLNALVVACDLGGHNSNRSAPVVLSDTVLIDDFYSR